MSDFLTPSADDFVPEERASGPDFGPVPGRDAAGGEQEADPARLHEAAARALHDFQAQWKAAGDEAMSYIRAHPGKAALAGLGVGFALGLMFRREQ